MIQSGPTLSLWELCEVEEERRKGWAVGAGNAFPSLIAWLFLGLEASTVCAGTIAQLSSDCIELPPKEAE